MVSPLFSPLKFNADGILTGIANNRIIMHHFGLKGSITPELKWNTKVTYSQNFGTYYKPFDPQNNQLSTLLNVNYSSSSFPLDLSLSLAADYGQIYENRLGAQLKISKTF